MVNLPTAFFRQHVIIVVQAGAQLMGLLVDAVNDILMVMADMVQLTPDIASGLAQSYVAGLITLDGKVLSLLQIIPQPELLAA